MYLDILKSTVEAEMWRNIPQEEDILRTRTGLQLFSIVELCGWSSGPFVVNCILQLWDGTTAVTVCFVYLLAEFIVYMSLLLTEVLTYVLTELLTKVHTQLITY